MCQLLGMNCNVPTDICFSFSGFQARGGATDVHSDGWGIAFFEGKGTRLFLDPQPSATSPVAELVRHYPIRSRNVIAHIRKATQGSVGLENTHPFMRELWGRYWIFAHNGNLLEFAPALDGSFIPVGLTDSERAFCWLLQELRRRFGSQPPSERAVLFDALHQLTLEIARFGEFNFLLSNGDCLFAHASAEAGHRLMLQRLNARPLLELDMRLGEGTGALLAVPLVKAACALLSEVAELSDVLEAAG